MSSVRAITYWERTPNLLGLTEYIKTIGRIPKYRLENAFN